MVKSSSPTFPWNHNRHRQPQDEDDNGGDNRCKRDHTEAVEGVVADADGGGDAVAEGYDEGYMWEGGGGEGGWGGVMVG